MRNLISVFFAFVLIATNACKPIQSDLDDIQIAFLADSHLNDIYVAFEDCDYKGVFNPANEKYVNIRTMASQLHSTRIFNENYFALRAALDDILKRGIEFVVLPGDFSDDGQPYNVKKIREILRSYTSKYGIQFFIITGNHDPVGPFTMDSGKPDFLGKDGRPQAIMSKEGFYNSQLPHDHPVVVTKDVSKLGYEQIVNILNDYGFFPQKDYKYWETPFSSYNYEDYKFNQAVFQSSISQRSYLVDSLGRRLPDVSYLVEPVDGLWLLALDGNVFLPSEKEDNNFKRASVKEGGEYSNVIRYKPYLIDWVTKVVKESERLNKTLIVFSHYPMIDFYDGAVEELKSLFGTGKMQLHRVPDKNIADQFAKAGVKIHFGGHLHLNDTGIKHYEDGSFLVNIQVPSLAGYPAAYKILTIKNPGEMIIETVKLDSVSGFNNLFPLYEKEYAYLQESGAEDIWNKDILSSKNYGDFLNWHLKELVRLRFLKRDWPEGFRNFMLNADGVALQKYAGVDKIDTTVSFKWAGFDMIFDFYRVLNADHLALNDIGSQRIAQYKSIINAELTKSCAHKPDVDSLSVDFHLFVRVFNDLLHGEPSDFFKIELEKGIIVDINPE
ncbi:metallophosphoesterase [Marinilabilia sp.]|uniref:metallophosphoesterase family protein n=1 Tax=Marinilabilia sp. TaxID=2021252 RepID=UPI0025C2ED9C|nr:metallophosphoesterase [Marinilabilia sp.]